MEYLYDLIVIGGGPGGYSPAILAARMGKKVAVIEKGALGGVCLNCGCIPTKTWLHTSKLYREIQSAEAGGLTAEGIRLDTERLHERKEAVTATLRDGIKQQFKKYKIDLYEGTGTVLKAHQVTVLEAGEIRELNSEYILVSTGSLPLRPTIQGIDLPGVENSTTMLKMKKLYDSLVIIGGGVIGMEFAQIYSDFGKTVTVLEAMDRVLPGMDREISQNLKMIMKKRGVEIHTGASVQRIEPGGEGKLSCVFVEKGQELAVESDGILVAIGRRSYGAEAFSKECLEDLLLDRGCLVVNENSQTSIEGVYAAGDVTGGIQLAHAAAAEGYRAVKHMFGGEIKKALQVIPSCVYTDPEIASAGMTVDEAKAAGIGTRTLKYIMSVNGRSVLSMQERGFIKLVVESGSGKVIGAQLMCARATDLIGELELAIVKGLTAGDLAEVVRAHPTFGEGIGEAAEEY